MSHLVAAVMSRPIVAHVVRSLATGGLENGVVNLVNATAERFQHVVVCMTTAGSFRARLAPGIDVVCLDKQPGREIQTLVRLARLLRRLRPAIVHSRNWPTIDAVIAARLAGVRVVLHGEHGREAADPNGRDARRNRARRALRPLITTFVAVSEDLRRWLIDDVRIPARKVVTIHNGVDLARFSGRERAAARAGLGLEPDTVAIGTVGRLDPVKDQARLVHAFAALAPRRPEVALVIAGDGPCRLTLERMVADLELQDRVRLLGDRRDIPAILAALDVFVLPSIAEGISNTILEAMATGLPVVATAVGGNPELVKPGISGMLVPVSDPIALAAAIENYVDDGHLRDLHGKGGRQRATERFSLGRMADAYTHLYGALA